MASYEQEGETARKSCNSRLFSQMPNILVFVRSKRITMSQRSLVQTRVMLDGEEVVVPFCVGECLCAVDARFRVVGGCRNVRKSWSVRRSWSEQKKTTS
jgi:hypothetical protein